MTFQLKLGETTNWDRVFRMRRSRKLSSLRLTVARGLSDRLDCQQSRSCQEMVREMARALSLRAGNGQARDIKVSDVFSKSQKLSGNRRDVIHKKV